MIVTQSKLLTQVEVRKIREKEDVGRTKRVAVRD